jgi:diguanylate cyclase (GGDEF)-like protein
MIETDLVADAGPIQLVRLRLTLALVAMAFIPIAVAAPILSTALDSQRASEQARVEREASGVATDVDRRLGRVSSALIKTGAIGAVGDFARTSKTGLAGVKAALADLSGDSNEGIVAATLLDLRGRQLVRAVDGQIAKVQPTTSVDPLVGAALSAAPGEVVASRAQTGADGSAHLAMATPVVAGTKSGMPAGVLRVEVSLDRFLELATATEVTGGRVVLVDGSGRAIAPGSAPSGLGSGATVGATVPLPGDRGWSARIVAPARFAPPPLPLIALLAAFVALIGILITWMARQVLRPAEELAASRGRLRDMYQLAHGDSLRDVLTGLGNHRAFQEAFERQVDAARTRKTALGLVLIDLDDFRAVNDSGGHAAGDQALTAFGQIIEGTLRTADRSFRTGGDEFALLLPGVTADGAAAVARRLLAASMDADPGRGRSALAVRSFSAGVSAYPALATDRRQLLDQADAALAWAKRHGRTSVETFDPGRHGRKRASTAAVVEQPWMDVAEVISRKLLRPVYQPIVDLRNGRIAGSEGLIRPMPDSGFANPAELFTAAELAGRIVELDLACLEIVAAGAATMADDSILTLNMSPRTLEADDFSVGHLVALVRKAGLDPTRIVLELTEREQIEEMERLRRNVAACRGAGFRLAADDVGAGNAGLRLLSQIQFDIVKIDLSLVQEGAVHEASMSVVGALQDLARRWGASVIAEGIETAAQLRVVRDLEIAAGQGYLLGRPASAEDLVALQATGIDIEALAKRDDWLHKMARAGAGMTSPASAR